MGKNRRVWIILGIGLAALAAGIVLTVINLTGGDSSPRTEVPGASEVNTLLNGIPQDGVVLGNPKAPVTLVEWGDLQCPFCREWATNAFPALVRDYVRPGKLQIVFRGLAFLGPDSTKTLQTALAGSVKGLDAGHVRSDARSSGVLAAISQTAQRADDAKVTGTPTFDIGRTGTKTFHRFNPSALTAPAFAPAIEQLLRG